MFVDELKGKGDDASSNLRKVKAEEKTKYQENRTGKVDMSSTNKSNAVNTMKSLNSFSAKSFPTESSIKLDRDTYSVSGFNTIKEKVYLPSGLKQQSSSDKDSVDTKKQTIYITDCIDVTFYIEPTKLNNIKMTNCVRVNVILNSLISTIEICDCYKLKIQVLGVVPSIAIDKTNAIDFYLSSQCKEVTEFISSKSGEMNVNLPENDNVDPLSNTEWIEIPVPEQFVHKLQKNNKLDTSISPLYSC